ncbi:S-adenosyl-L-methionine-dependent protein-lysine N- methyltransferase [Teratosphaeria destructans]|uniref:Protein-lysine N-methyltransferase EFM6 n=1 Tax=Teratosphaeria destructans TaxID=418781 RepID=A0A9W7VY46_9PEZI|nr:S-adenosyl-L-methionine-dependent protein-lysine N- methyltransferase [Teratosphaeria destructans]
MSDTEAGADVFTISEDLVCSPAHKQASTGEVDFDGLLEDRPLKLHQDLAKGNGGQAWPAGHVLARYLLRKKREELKKCSMFLLDYSVELGAGGGLVGLAIALGCAPEHSVHVTDQQPMLQLMQDNIALNGLTGRAQASVYNWGDACPEGIPAHPDIVLAADCVYFEPAFPLLQKTLEDLIGPHTVCYFCFKKRRRADTQFMKAAKKVFAIEQVDDDPDQETYARENITLCTIRLKTDRRGLGPLALGMLRSD